MLLLCQVFLHLYINRYCAAQKRAWWAVNIESSAELGLARNLTYSGTQLLLELNNGGPQFSIVALLTLICRTPSHVSALVALDQCLLLPFSANGAHLS